MNQPKEAELGNLKVLRGLYLFLIISLIVMPQYFGVHIGVDLTCTRFAVIFITMYFIMNSKLMTHFYHTIIKCEVVYPLILYLMVAGYTMVFRVDINAFFMVFLEVLTFFYLIYGIRYVVGFRTTWKITIGCAYFLGIYGLTEFVYGKSIFHQFLSTVPNKVTNYYRSGHYRIMGPCGHSLGYGLLLLILVAAACYDMDKKRIYLFQRPLLFLILGINVFLTGSRSALAFFFVEVLVIFLLSSWRDKKITLFYALAAIVALGAVLMVIQKTSIGQYLLGQIASVIDEVFGTTYAANFGIDTQRLEDSTNYRKALPYIFTLDWLNPLVGRGNKFSGAEINGVFIESIDNYYVAQYIKFAYPGLIAYVLYLLVALFVLLRDIVKGDNFAKIILVGLVMYFASLWYVDALQTLKFSYLFLALFYARWLYRKSDMFKSENA
ncbi:MAG: O-antigen ligase family protein [Lachnospiraceae bacterium]|nr:O-antigen ligase family protein [Lachnospiraceae bacterium]